MPVTEKRFRIAFSFAGEVREFVEKTAHILAAKFGQDKILYDKFHESEFGRWNLGIYLPKLYGEESDLIVAVLSPAYDEKRWTGWEWAHIYGLLTKADGHRVLISRFKYAQVDGLSPAAGFIELDSKTPEQFADLILERLAINEGKARGHYKGPGVDVPPQHNLSALEPEHRSSGAVIDGSGGKVSHQHLPKFLLPAIHKLLIHSFTSQDFDTFVFLNFLDVHKGFVPQMPQGARINELMQRCLVQGSMQHLLALVEVENSHQYGLYGPYTQS